MNVNSIRNKFSSLLTIIKNFDIFLISEAKLDSSFPNRQFGLPSYKLFRKDRNGFGGGLIFYVKDDIPCKPLNNHDSFSNSEILVLEIHDKKRKWLLIGVYKPPSQSDKNFIDTLMKILDFYGSNYENIFIIGDFNLTVKNHYLDMLLNLYDLSSLIDKPTCHKSQNPSCIDLILTNRKTLFNLSNTFEVGISDHHELVSTILKTGVVKGPPQVKIYRSYKNFDLDSFNNTLEYKIKNLSSNDYDNLKKTFEDTLNIFAPLKKKTLRNNHSPFMTKELRKEIMKRSRLKRIYNRNKRYQDWENYKNQRNLCYSLLRRTKKQYFNNINLKDISDNKKFWKCVTPYFSEKGSASTKLMLIENEEILTNESKLANVFNDFFLNVTADIDIKRYPCMKTFNFENLKAKFANHESITKIKDSNPISNTDRFCFTEFTEEEVRLEISNLSSDKASTYGSIPVSILKQSIDVFIGKLTSTINHSLASNKFPDRLKNGEIIPVYKKKDPLKKDNYRPVTLLSHLSKVFERLIHKQMYSFMENKLSKYMTGFRSNHGTQHSLIAMLERWKHALDKGEYVSSLFMDLSKAFDTINHDLLLAKLEAYGFSKISIEFMHSYLKNRKQRVLINNSFSESKKVTIGVPQGSILGPLLFNIFVNDFLYSLKNSEISNYADDNTMYCIGKDKARINSLLEQDFQLAAEWFYKNGMVLNPDKCHYMCLGSNVDGTEEFNSLSYKLNNSKEEKMLGIVIDRNLKFENHIDSICRKASQKLSALNRISPYLDINKRKIIYNSMIKSQFSYCPLVWMFCSRKSNNKINQIHERALRLSFNDNHSDFNSLLENNNETTIHYRNIQILVTEIYKVINGIAPPIMDSLFRVREVNYNLRNIRTLESSTKKTVKYGLETLSYRSPTLWSLVPPEIKYSYIFQIKNKKLEM